VKFREEALVLPLVRRYNEHTTNKPAVNEFRAGEKTKLLTLAIFLNCDEQPTDALASQLLNDFPDINLHAPRGNSCIDAADL
jgi:hypothetical protein